MSPASVRLKKLADRLSEDDAELVLAIARQVLRRRTLPRDDRADEVEARRRLADPEDPVESYDEARRDLGLAWIASHMELKRSVRKELEALPLAWRRRAVSDSMRPAMGARACGVAAARAAC